MSLMRGGRDLPATRLNGRQAEVDEHAEAKVELGLSPDARALLELLGGDVGRGGLGAAGCGALAPLAVGVPEGGG